MKELFLDANAHVPMSQNTIKIYSEFLQSRGSYGHPSAPSKLGQESALALEKARAKMAELLHCEPQNLIITSSCTQACEWGLSLLPPGPVYSSGMEHSAVYQKLGEYKLLSNKNSLVVEKEVEGNIACVYVQNEIGTIQPINYLKPKSGLLFSDMCQAPGKIDINLRDMPVDIATFGAHKWGGPTGIGLLYLNDLVIYKEYGTGSRYFNDRPGTPDVAGVIAAAAALEETIVEKPWRIQNMQQFQSVLEDRLQDMGLEIIGKDVPRVANTTFVKIPNKAFLILNELSNKGIYVGMGSACGSMHTGPSRTMNTLGITGDAHDFLRISQHGDYVAKDALYLVDEISKLIRI